VRYTIIWESSAREMLTRLRQRDGDAVRPLVRAINNPMYEIDSDRIAVTVLTVGTTPR
jgi:mRNA interferase RelE/StbE